MLQGRHATGTSEPGSPIYRSAANAESDYRDRNDRKQKGCGKYVANDA